MLRTIVRTGFALLFLALQCASPPRAFAQVAPGVLQSAAHTATVTGTVTQNSGAPMVGADVRLTGPSILDTKTDAQGDFQFFSVPYGTYQIVVSSSLGVTTQDNVAINGDVNVAVRYAPRANGNLRTIASVTTRSQGTRINVTPASIVSVNPSAFAFEGNTSWKNLLERIPGVTVGGNLSKGGGPTVVVPYSPLQPIVLSVNGAPPSETSVTLDGLPLYNTSYSAVFGPGSGTDLSYLPMAMFDTADVVRGPGADAPSVVDSIGGSFVLHAPGEVNANHFEMSTSRDPYGGFSSNSKAAFHMGRLSATFLYGFYNSPGPLGPHSLIPANTLAPSTVNGQPFLNCTAPSNCSTELQNPNPRFPNCFCQWLNSLVYCCVPSSTEWTQHTGSVALSYKISPSVAAEVFYAGSSLDQQLPQARFPVDFEPGPGYTGSIAPGLHTYIYNNGAQQINQAASLLEEKVTAFFGGGVLRFAALQNNSFYEQTYPARRLNGNYTLYGTGNLGTAPGTPVVFNGTPAYLTFTPFSVDNRGWSNNRGLLMSYGTQVGVGTDIGISYVTSYYNNPQQAVTYFNGGTFPSTRSTAVSQTTDELRFHVGSRVSEKLSLDASWYFAQGAYHIVNPSNAQSWADSNFPYNAPRLGVVWHASPDVVLRGSAGGGYALPPLQYLVGSNSISCGVSSCRESVTNINLKPEQSFGFDLGTDVRFRRDTVFSFDLYRTNLYGQFFNSTNIIGDPTGASGGLPLYVTKVSNLAQTRYEGVNLDIRRDIPSGVFWHAALGLTRAYVVNVPPGFYNPSTPGGAMQNGYIVPGINFDGAYQSTIPYANGTAEIGYRWAPEKFVSVTSTYYGNNNAYFEPAFLALDANAGYPLTRNFSLHVIFKNITGAYGQDYQSISPTFEMPVVPGAPTTIPGASIGIPYGPRSVILTAKFTY